MNVRSQVELRTRLTHNVRSEVERRVDTTHRVRSEISRRIDALKSVHSQVEFLKNHTVHSQVLIALYNTNRLRVLMDFPSRGTTGTNWTANSTEPGDFSVNNLNTDIVEQVWRSSAGTKTGIVLTCDTQVPQGVFMDTFAMLGHNLTTSASILLEGSTSAGFASIGISIPITSRRDNIYYISPQLPLQTIS